MAVSVDVRLPHRPPHITESCLSQPGMTTTPRWKEEKKR